MSVKLRSTRNDTTQYSAAITGDKGNHLFPVRFDLTGQYLGITTTDPVDGTIERVLLSPAQVRALIQFVTLERGSSVSR